MCGTLGSVGEESWQRQIQCGKLRRRRFHVLVFVHRLLKRKLSRKRLVLKKQLLATLCSNSLSLRRSRSSLIRCNSGWPKSSGRSSATRLMHRLKRLSPCVVSYVSRACLVPNTENLTAPV